MKGMYFEFARLVIRLLLGIYLNVTEPPFSARQAKLIADSEAWLEKHK
jgi:hypothetical protein